VAAPKLVWVEWVDAVADIGWEETVKASIHPATTVGFLIDETKDAICLASTWSINMTNNRMHIPKIWIKKRKVISIETKQRKAERKATAAVDKRPDPQDIPTPGA
jgi:hypothetical protein